MSVMGYSAPCAHTIAEIPAIAATTNNNSARFFIVPLPVSNETNQRSLVPARRPGDTNHAIIARLLPKDHQTLRVGVHGHAIAIADLVGCFSNASKCSSRFSPVLKTWEFRLKSSERTCGLAFFR